MNFFKRFYVSIFKLEDYPKFFEEKVSKSLGYFAILILITAIILCIFMTIEIGNMFEKGYAFFKTIPDFKYENGTIAEDIFAYGYDEEYNSYFLIDTSKNYKTNNEISEVALKEYGDNYLDSEISILAYKENVYINYYGSQTIFNYNDVLTDYGVTNIDKATIEKNIDEFGVNNLKVAFFIYSMPFEYISLFISFIVEVVMLTIFALVVAYMICRIDLKFSNGFRVSAHAITLSVVITLIYNIVNFFTGFYMEYFSYMTIIIEYVYVIAVMFMIKVDKQKLEEELAKVEVVRAEVAKEIANENEEKELNDDNEKENVKEQNEEINDENQEEINVEEKDENNDENNDDKDDKLKEEDKQV